MKGPVSFCSKFVVLLPVLMGPIWLTGCVVGDSVVTTSGVATATGTLTGRLVDYSTNQPIGGATVIVIVNGVKQTAVTDNSSDPDLKGMFVFNALPAGSHTFEAKIEGYATRQFTFFIPQSSDNTPATINVGQVMLRKPFSLTVMVTSDGLPVQGVTVVAEPQQYMVPGYASSVTDAAGQAVIAGLDQDSVYTIIAPPADVNGDGVYDYQGGVAMYDGATNSATILSLPITKSQRDDVIELVFSSLSKRGSPNVTLTRMNLSGVAGEHVVVDNVRSYAAKDAPIHLVFNYPVSLDGDVLVLHRQILVNPDQVNNTTGVAPGDGVADADFDTDEALAATASLDATGTILTITPPAGGFPKNDVITLGGVVKADVNGVSSKVSLRTLLGGIYVFDDTSSGLGSATVLTADNYNGSGSNYSNGEVPYIEFPEYVTGNIRYISITHTQGTAAVGDDVSYVINGSPQDISSYFYYSNLVYTDGASSTTCPSCGTGAGSLFRVQLPNYYDGRAVDGDLITVQIDAKDVEGNVLQGTYTLRVQ